MRIYTLLQSHHPRKKLKDGEAAICCQTNPIQAIVAAQILDHHQDTEVIIVLL